MRWWSVRKRGCQAAGDWRHGVGGGDRVCPDAAGIGAGKRAWQPGECRPADRRAVGPRAGVDESGSGLARGQFAHQLWRRRHCCRWREWCCGPRRLYRLRCHGDARCRRWILTRLSLNWPRWYPTTADDRQKEAQTLSTLANAGQISRERRRSRSSPTRFDIEDVAGGTARSISRCEPSTEAVDARRRDALADRMRSAGRAARAR